MTRALRYRPGCWWLAAACWSAFIYWLNTRPGVPQPGFWLPPHTDKAVHAFLYAVLGGTLYLALRASGLHPVNAAMLATVFASCYGITDEWRQMSVEGRSSDVLDWLADTAGALAATAWLAVRHPLRTIPWPEK